jgi:hypothetical protein
MEMQVPLWESNGIYGRADLHPRPACAGNYHGTAVVLGSARCIWDDIDKVDFEKVEVIAINNMIMHFKGRVHHGVSLHPEEPPLWRQLRMTNQCEPSYVHTHSHRLPENNENLPQYDFKTRHGLDYIWVIEGGRGGSSGLFATMVGLALGYEKIILCGVPLDGSGHFFDPPGKVVNQFRGGNIKEEWLNANEKYFKGRVTSYSGQTREWLGAPENLK